MEKEESGRGELVAGSIGDINFTNELGDSSKVKNIRKYVFVLVFLILLAGSIRVININSAKFYFTPIRQVQSFIIARYYYFNKMENVKQWRKDVAYRQMSQIRKKEPRITEFIVSSIYLLLDKEEFWVPSLVCSIFWVIGSVFVCITAKLYSSPCSSLIGTAYFLLVPFGIVQSRSFQPESLMIMIYLVSLYFLIRYGDKATLTNLFFLALICGLSVMIKISVIFPLIGAFVFVEVAKKGAKKGLFSLPSIIFVSSLLPGYCYYLYLVFISKEMSNVASFIFRPELLLYRYFWIGWWERLQDVTGILPLILGITGLLLTSRKTVRYVLAGSLIGYVIYGILFTYTTATHNYYQVCLIPLVALSLPLFADYIFTRIKSACLIVKLSTVMCVIYLVLFLMIGLYGIHKGWHHSEKKMPRFLTKTAAGCCGLCPKYLSKYFKHQITYDFAREIGEEVNHSLNTIFLSRNNLPCYFGEYAGVPFPYLGFVTEKAYSSREVFLQAYSRKYLTKWSDYEDSKTAFVDHFLALNPEYLIVTEMDFLNSMPEFKTYLHKNYRSVVDEDYIIFIIEPSCLSSE